MQISMNLRRVVVGTLLPMLLGLPLPSAAATPSPQMALNRALMNDWSGQATRVDMTVSAGVTEKPYDLRLPTKSGSIGMRFQSRTLPAADGRLAGDSEGRVTLEKLAIDGFDSPIPVKLDGPVSVQWKLANKTAFFQLERIPASLLDVMKSESGTDYAALVGRWIKIDGDDFPTNTAFVKTDDESIKRLKAIAVRTPPLLVSRVESRTKSADGHDVWRMRLYVNPLFINALYAEALKEMPKTPAATRAAAIKSLNATFANIRSTLWRTGLVAMVDVTANRLVRFEVGGRYPSAVKNCTYVYPPATTAVPYPMGRQVCKTTGTRTVTVSAGMSIAQDGGAPIDIPGNALTKDELEALLNPRTYEPIPVEPELAPPQEQLQPDFTGLAPVDSADHVLGSPNAIVTVVTYSDFQCPFCKTFEPSLMRLLSEFPLDTRIVYRHFPLSNIHPQAQKAAEASECAAYLGGESAFWRMEAKLFENQQTFGLDQYPLYAEQIGLNKLTFAQCIDSDVMAIRINRDVTSAVAAGVNGTPTTFVNGVRMDGAISYDDLKTAAMRSGAVK